VVFAGRSVNYYKQLKGSVKEPNMFHNYEIEIITRKASDAAEYKELFGSSAQDRHANICVVHDNLGWKNRTTRYNCRFSAMSLALLMIFSGGTTEQHVTAGFGELAAVN